MGEKELKLFIKVGDDKLEELTGFGKRVEKIEIMGELEMRKSLLETILGGKVYKLTNKICKLEIEKESIEKDISKIEAEREYLTKIKVLVRYFKSEDDKKTLGLRLNDSEILENIDFYGAKEAYKRLVKYIEYNCSKGDLFYERMRT